MARETKPSPNAPIEKSPAPRRQSLVTARPPSDIRFFMESATLPQTADAETSFDPTRIAADIETLAGGGRFSSGVDGAYFGRGADFIIIDDPTKPEDALSDNRREEVNHIVDTKLRTRLDTPSKGRIVIVQQRQNIRDLTGHLTAKEDWTVVSFPAIAERDESITFQTRLGWDRHERSAGQALQPGRLSLDKMKNLSANMGTAAFQAQYQQQPMPPGGNIVKEEWIHQFRASDAPVSYEYLIQSWDTASTVGKSSAYSVCLTFGVHSRNMYLIGCLRQQVEFPSLQNSIQTEWERFAQRPAHILIEEKSSGIALLQHAKNAGLPAKGVKPKDPKEVRLQIVSGLIQNGTILFPRHTPWIDGLLSELITFPQSAHSDQVDALSQALGWYQERLGKTVFEFDFGFG